MFGQIVFYVSAAVWQGRIASRVVFSHVTPEALSFGSMPLGRAKFVRLTILAHALPRAFYL